MKSQTSLVPNTVKRGDLGVSVRLLQILLGVAPDAKFGPGTDKALRDYQESHHLLVDGVCGEITWSCLEPEAPHSPEFLLSVAKAMCPQAPTKNVEGNFPDLYQAVLTEISKPTAEILCMAIATYYTENRPFKPLEEGVSKWNTVLPDGAPFAKYDFRTDIGNHKQGHGARYRGRGPIQLTGLANYRRYGQLCKVDLEALPEKAADNKLGCKILCLFLNDKRAAICHALRTGALPKARKLINGGSHGLDIFSKSYKAGHGVLKLFMEWQGYQHLVW